MTQQEVEYFNWILKMYEDEVRGITMIYVLDKNEYIRQVIRSHTAKKDYKPNLINSQLEILNVERLNMFKCYKQLENIYGPQTHKMNYDNLKILYRLLLKVKMNKKDNVHIPSYLIVKILNCLGDTKCIGVKGSKDTKKQWLRNKYN